MTFPLSDSSYAIKHQGPVSPPQHELIRISPRNNSSFKTLNGIDMHAWSTCMQWAIECFERGILTRDDTDGLELRFGNGEAMLEMNQKGFFPYTPATNLLFGLWESIQMLEEEGLQNVFERHDRHAEATRRAVREWGLEILCADPQEYSSSLTAVMMPNGHSADTFRKVVLEHFNMSLGNGLGKVADKVFRIGHLGDFNDLMLAGTLSGVEMGLSLADIPNRKGGVAAALAYLESIRMEG